MICIGLGWTWDRLDMVFAGPGLDRGLTEPGSGLSWTRAGLDLGLAGPGLGWTWT